MLRISTTLACLAFATAQDTTYTQDDIDTVEDLVVDYSTADSSTVA